ncbi:hypothetical protein [Ancylobacter lacus]|uniref:hypothetical protein n=1 Tax=Ancylobacter lacus TaxID=2579970 RepID=UPI001BD113D3|nr:hypothetical protein [Ancylobacter lacus]MBS7541254.1 hypothetical protein [Ancylobacter lacus]
MRNTDTSPPRARPSRPAATRALALRAEASRRDAAGWLMLVVAAGLAALSCLHLIGALP